jgi:hypothetical protein
MKNDVLVFIDNLPLLPYEVAEVKAAYERSLHYSWVQAREEIAKLSDDRIDEKHDKKLKALLTEDKVNQLVKIDDILLYYIEDLWMLGYSSAAISKALKYSVSSSRISQLMPPVSKRKRGQVIELLNDFITEFDVERWRIANCGSYRTGPRITEEEKQKFKDLYRKGYSIDKIAYMTGRSANAVRKWVK